MNEMQGYIPGQNFFPSLNNNKKPHHIEWFLCQVQYRNLFLIFPMALSGK